jgi:hypothetical protein
MMRALIAAAMFALCGTNAFAVPTCASLTPTEVEALPNGGLPSGDTFETSSSSFPAGSLTNFVDLAGYTVCSSGSTTTYSIPFFLTNPAQILLGITQINNISGTFFGVSIDGSSVLQQDSPVVPPNISLLTNVAAGIGLLGITENYGTTGLTEDALAVGITLEKFLPTIPEPATLSLLGLGAACLAAARRRQRLRS